MRFIHTNNITRMLAAGGYCIVYDPAQGNLYAQNTPVYIQYFA